MRPQRHLEVTAADQAMMQRALDLAARGIGLVSPNPLVGCVITDANGEVVGEGFYRKDRVVHAEVVALDQAGERARGGTAYVSLEPHDHHGQTSPCTEALIKAGIARVVCPIEDPNPLVSGRGFQKLRDAGIEVTTGVLADKAARQNEKFICWHQKQRPFIHLKLAMSLDGRISLGRNLPTAFSGESARSRVHELRHEYDAILVGGNTAAVDDPLLTDRSGHDRRRSLVRVVLDDRLHLSTESKLATTTDTAPTLVFTNSADVDRIEGLRSLGVDVVRLPVGARDLKAVLAELRQRDIQSLLVEGGSEVAGSFVDSKLVDKVTFIYSPVIAGGPNAPNAIGGKGVDAFDDALRLRDLAISQLGDDVEVTGYPS